MCHKFWNECHPKQNEMSSLVLAIYLLSISTFYTSLNGSCLQHVISKFVVKSPFLCSIWTLESGMETFLDLNQCLLQFKFVVSPEFNQTLNLFLFCISLNVSSDSYRPLASYSCMCKNNVNMKGMQSIGS